MVSRKEHVKARPLDTDTAGRGVWLLKVPKYMDEAWSKSSVDDLGCMTISSQGGRTEVSFTISDKVDDALEDEMKIPCKHKVLVQGVQSQCLCVFSESSSGKLCAEGKVAQRAEIQPIVSKTYMNLKKRQIEDAGKPKYQVEQLTKMPRSIKPVSDHKVNIKYDEKKKEEGKRVRMDKELVLDLIFSAFQQHQYYNFKDLVAKTKQPPVYLKQILQEVCIYNTKNPHKNMWELKSEYRHYKKSPSPTAAGAVSGSGDDGN